MVTVTFWLFLPEKKKDWHKLMGNDVMKRPLSSGCGVLTPPASFFFNDWENQASHYHLNFISSPGISVRQTRQTLNTMKIVLVIPLGTTAVMGHSQTSACMIF